MMKGCVLRYPTLTTWSDPGGILERICEHDRQKTHWCEWFWSENKNIHAEVRQNKPETYPESRRNNFGISRESTRNLTRINQESTKNQPESTPNRSQDVHKSIFDKNTKFSCKKVGPWASPEDSTNFRSSFLEPKRHEKWGVFWCLFSCFLGSFFFS